MAETSHIEWTDATWNPITGCSVVSPGCTNCYAMKLAGTRLKNHPSRAGLTRDSKAGPVWNGVVRLNEQWLAQPLSWKRPRMIFVCAHGDLFHESVPDEWIDQVFAVMAEAHWHTFQVLTKRAERMRAYIGSDATLERIGLIQRRVHDDSCAYTNVAIDGIWPLSNVWLGVSVEDQARANERIPALLATPAQIRFLSAEPLLGPIDFYATSAVMPVDAYPWANGPILQGIDWVIAGGESGRDARPMYAGWARILRDQCADADVAFFFKQWGSFRPLTNAERGQACGSILVNGDRYDRDSYMLPATKKSAGRLLDGVEHNDLPQPRGVPAL